MITAALTFKKLHNSEEKLGTEYYLNFAAIFCTKIVFSVLLHLTSQQAWEVCTKADANI